MRKIFLLVLLSLLGLNWGGRAALADGMIIPEPLSPDYLAVRYHRVTVTIEDGHAVTHVEQEFYNPHSVPVSGRYTFPVPPDAILSGFKATVDGQPQAVTRQDAATTNAALYDLIVERRDPSLLQYADWETLAFDLNLPPGGSRQMSLEYEEVLAPTGGLYRYKYILSTERYSSRPLDEVSLTVNVTSSGGLASLYSPTHNVTTEWGAAGQGQATWQAAQVRPGDDFELYFAPARGGFGGGLLIGERDGQGHFLFLFAPEPEQVNTDTIPKDIVFVIDRSGSMSGEKIEQAHNALHFILGQLGEQDRFSVVGFDDELVIWAEALRPANRENLADARQFVTTLSADGGTNLEGGLQAGLDILAGSEQRDAPAMVVFLTDGLPTAGITDEGLIARLVTDANSQLEARLHVFGVGYDVNTHLLDRLAADNGGSVTYVQPGENLETVLTGFYAQIAHPALTDIEIEFDGLEPDALYPQQIPDMFRGSSLLLTGQYRATAPTVTVRVRGQAGGEPREYTYTFDLPETAGHDFVPRLWATRRVGDLLDRVRVEGETPALVEEIRALGLSYGLVTPYTTFVVEAQTEGAASAANMGLYMRSDELNQASGEVTVQARLQNQSYQQAGQANLASGANIIQRGDNSLAQMAGQNIDLALLQEQENINGPITPEWIAQNIQVDRYVVFGSEGYFALVEDPGMRAFLQSGPNVIFEYGGEVISVQTAEPPAQASPEPDPATISSRQEESLGFGAWLWRMIWGR
jgi:Ca-activated chloride channel family protein